MEMPTSSFVSAFPPDSIEGLVVGGTSNLLNTVPGYGDTDAKLRVLEKTDCKRNGAQRGRTTDSNARHTKPFQT